jgi:hypothetical protein
MKADGFSFAAPGVAPWLRPTGSRIFDESAFIKLSKNFWTQGANVHQN